MHAMIQEARRDGMMFVVSPASVLPGRCVKCNAECSSLRISRRISTFSAWYPLFSSAGWNAHCADDRPIHITFSLCLRHRLESLARAALIGFVAVANILWLVIFKITPKIGPTADVLAVVLPPLFILMTLSLRPILRPRRVHQGLAWFAGAGIQFLNSLPEMEAHTKTISSSPTA
jgi:hypothetical protein